MTGAIRLAYYSIVDIGGGGGSRTRVLNASDYMSFTRLGCYMTELDHNHIKLFSPPGRTTCSLRKQET